MTDRELLEGTLLALDKCCTIVDEVGYRDKREEPSEQLAYAWRSIAKAYSIVSTYLEIY